MPRGRPRKSAASPAAASAAPAAPVATRTRIRRSAAVQVPFSQTLALNQWLFGLFGLESFNGYSPVNGSQRPLLEAFKQRFQINEYTMEGLDENNIHRFHHALVNQIETLPELNKDLLLAYDQNIVRYTQRLNEQRLRARQEPIVWKYYQYLALLFSEIYLDRYFADPQALAKAINAHIGQYNAEAPESAQLPLLDDGREAALNLNKLAFWCATGSGKTLLMHVHILQYQHYLEKHGQSSALNRIILLTPNEGLSKQHLAEFQTAGIEAELFDKNGRGLFAGRAVEIIDIHKLKEEMGDKTVAVDAFESNNLVLVDEGHRGASGGEAGLWLDFRRRLSEKGFSFEYSATFAQAVKGNAPLRELYARSILFDYSYRYFYGDGFGKDYQILNLDETNTHNDHRELYLAACLLAFYQQLRYFDDQGIALRPFGLDRPLWIFVGGSVNAVRTEAGAQTSDVVEILLFLSRFASGGARSVQAIQTLLTQGLVTSDGRNLFHNRFAWLAEQGQTAEQILTDILTRLFNAPGGGVLHVELLKGTDGELALKLGDNPAFGVINVGDAPKLLALCEQSHLATEERDFKGSLFQQLSAPDSRVHLLIGSRKFTEGWNSYRVCTMGLMKIGATEGAQIIQLFGRGVRLRGYNLSLKRSSKTALPAGVTKPKHLALLETLNVFGIKADYMAQFKQYLEEEGLPVDDSREEIILPVVRNLGTHKLKVIRLKKIINGIQAEFGTAFRKIGPLPVLAPPVLPAEQWLIHNKVTLNWYPRIQAMQAAGAGVTQAEAALQTGKLTTHHVALLNLDRIWFALQAFKAERGWHNLHIPQDCIPHLLANPDWYELQIPATSLALDSFDKLTLWQDIAETLLRKYCERYYTYQKRAWEEPHLEYQELTADDPNFPEAATGYSDGCYRIQVEKTEAQLIAQIKQMRDQLAQGSAGPWTGLNFRALRFREHLYEPLIHVSGAVIEVRPVSLNEGEMCFVEDLKSFVQSNPKELTGKRLYLLRNMSRGKGVGFFEAGNFYPDFMLWLVDGVKQHIGFVDPKGIRNLSWNDPKLEFHKTIKEIERRLSDSDVRLESFIVSNTPSATMALLWNTDKNSMQKRHILFQVEDQAIYIGKLISALG